MSNQDMAEILGVSDWRIIDLKKRTCNRRYITTRRNFLEIFVINIITMLRNIML